MYEVIDVTEWMVDEQYAIFPIGARDKQMIWSPELGAPEGIKPNWPYLFKESISRYPDQYWTELVAYMISKHLNVDVPRVFPAVINTLEGTICGSLIEWFYDVNTERFIHAGTFFKGVIPDFDEKTGKEHNLVEMGSLIRWLSINQNLTTDRLTWIADMAFFDALIGNTDRHQDNWGVTFLPNETCKLSPFFDNGTSLGHERFIDRIRNWTPQQLLNYVLKGKHHLRINRENTKERINHFELVNGIAKVDPDIKIYMQNKLANIDVEGMLAEIKSLSSIEIQIPLSEQRIDWIIKNIIARLELIKEVLEKNDND